MVEQVLESVFAHAAMSRKVVMVILVLALFGAPVLAFLARSGGGPWRRLLSDLRIAGPALGLLVGAMNSFHMARTIQKLSFDVTAKQLAPGILEVSTFMVLGGLVGLVAIATMAVGDACVRR